MAIVVSLDSHIWVCKLGTFKSSDNVRQRPLPVIQILIQFKFLQEQDMREDHREMSDSEYPEVTGPLEQDQPRDEETAPLKKGEAWRRIQACQMDGLACS